jgi:hypothetical protein
MAKPPKTDKREKDKHPASQADPTAGPPQGPPDTIDEDGDPNDPNESTEG